MRPFVALPVLLALPLAGCFSDAGESSVRGTLGITGQGEAHINDRTKFSRAAYGVVASPRVTRSRTVRKGGGRRQIGKPYVVRGKRYVPRLDRAYDRTGQASWYGPNFHGRLTANGEVYDQFALSAAHPTFPLPSYARVTNQQTGASVVVRVNDRGPFHSQRIIDLSARAADLLGYRHAGTAKVRVQYVGEAPLHGRDERYLASTFRKNGPSFLDRIVTASVKVRRRPDDPFLAEARTRARDELGRSQRDWDHEPPG